MAGRRPKFEPSQADLNRTPEEWDERARNILINQLTRSAKTKHQLSQLLDKKFVPQEIAQTLLERFTEVGLIDDAAYARAFAHDKRLTRGLSKSAIKRELAQAGVDQELILDAIEPIDSQAELELAIRLVEKRWSSVARLERDARYRRLSGYLGRRGFAGSTISSAIHVVASSESAR
jgi:regulatory protein